MSGKQILIEALENISKGQHGELKAEYIIRVMELSKQSLQQYNSTKDSGGCNFFYSPVQKEREWQEAELKKIFPNYPNDCELWQYLNGLIRIANARVC